MTEQPIFITGMHKSGTSLLRSLLDGHANLFVVPFESHFFPLAGFAVDNEYQFSLPGKSARENLVDRFFNFINTISRADAGKGGNALMDSIDPDLFRQTFTGLLSGRHLNDREIFMAYYEAIAKSLPGKCNDNHLVEKSVENAEFAESLSRWFPDARFLHIVRNPYSNIVSLRKFKATNHGFPLINRVIRTFYNNYYYLYRNTRLITNYKVVRYEDLVKNVKDVMNDICTFLGIEPNENMYKPTSMGKLWAGNSMYESKFEGVDDRNLDKWRKYISPMEINYLNRAFPHVFEDYGYEMLKPGGSIMKPVKGENLKRYVYNRMYSFYLRHYTNYAF